MKTMKKSLSVLGLVVGLYGAWVVGVVTYKFVTVEMPHADAIAAERLASSNH
ncbi:hypothetical protein D3C87_125190 [compost metagenome]